MNKKIIVMAAFAAVLGMSFTACSNNDDDMAGAGNPVTGEAPMGFDINIDGNAHVTRGVATTATNAPSQIADFQTWAYDATSDVLYMGNSASEGRTVTNTGTALAPVWSYEPQQFWPVNNLSFVAITPNSYSAVSANATSSASGVVSIASTVNIPVNVEEQKDLMYADAANKNKDSHAGNVPFTFKHALSQIVFKGKFSDAGAVTKVTVKDITLMNVKNAGTVNFTSAGTFPAINWPATPTKANYQLDASDLEGSVFDVADEGTTAFDLTISENTTKSNAWFLLPQQLDGSGTLVKAGGAAPTDGKNYIRVSAKLEKDGVTILNDTDPIYIPVGTNWERSKKYIYTIVFNGESALTPITFSVEAQDWTDVNVDPLEM